MRVRSSTLTSDIVTSAQVPATDLAERFDWTIAYPSGLHARPATRWAETARRFAPAPRCVPATRRPTPRVWSRCCNLACAWRCRQRVCRGRRCPCPADRAAQGHGGPGRAGKGRCRARSQRKTTPVAGWNPPERRLPSSASAPALGWQSARCMYWPARRPRSPIARPRSAKAGRVCRTRSPYPPAVGRAAG
jgi:hypothetical protein